MKIFSYSIYRGGFWIRIFGVGFTIINRNKVFPPFSVRIGITKEFRIGKYGFQYLRKTKVSKGIIEMIKEHPYIYAPDRADIYAELKKYYEKDKGQMYDSTVDKTVGHSGKTDKGMWN